VPFDATVTVELEEPSTDTVILSPGTPVPDTGTELPLLDGTDMPGAGGGALTVTETVPLAGLVNPDTGSVCVAENVCAPGATVTVADQLECEHDAVPTGEPPSRIVTVSLPAQLPESDTACPLVDGPEMPGAEGGA